MNKQIKSIPAFVVGLIGGIVGIIGSIIPLACAAAVAGLDGGVFYAVVCCCFLLPAILAIIGAALCFKKARVGAIILVFATVLSIVGLVLYGLSIATIIALIMYAVAAILGFVAKAKD